MPLGRGRSDRVSDCHNLAWLVSSFERLGATSDDFDPLTSFLCGYPISALSN